MANIGGLLCFGPSLFFCSSFGRLVSASRAAGRLIHVLLVVALAVLILQLLTGRRVRRSCSKARNALHRCEVNSEFVGINSQKLNSQKLRTGSRGAGYNNLFSL
jgi:small-conductance mechanosensitive channel